MNTSSRVPGVTRNSGWHAVDAEMSDRRVRQQRQDAATEMTRQPSK